LLIKQIEQLRRLNLITNQISTATNCKKIIERQRQIYPSVFLRLTSDMDTDAPRIDERKRMRVSSPVPAPSPPRYDEDGDLQADEIEVDLTDELKQYTDDSSCFDTNPVIIDPPGIDELLLQRNELFQNLYEELDSLKTSNIENGDLQKVFTNMAPLPTTTQLGGKIIFVLMYPPTSSLKANDSLDNQTMRKVMGLGIKKEEISIVETFPYAHKVKSGSFDQTLLERLLRDHYEFRCIICKYIEDMICLERAAQLVRDDKRKKTLLYVGGGIASFAVSNLPSLQLTLTHMPCPGVSAFENFIAYTGVHPSHVLMSRGHPPALAQFVNDLLTIKALSVCAYHWQEEEESMRNMFNLHAAEVVKERVASKEAVIMWLQDEKIELSEVLHFRASGLHMTNVEHLSRVKTIMYEKYSQQWKDNLVLFFELAFTYWYIEGTEDQIKFTVGKMATCSGFEESMIRIILRRCKSEHDWNQSHERMAQIKSNFPNAGAFLSSGSAWSAAGRTNQQEWDQLLVRFASVVADFPNAGAFLFSNSAWAAAGRTNQQKWDQLLVRFANIPSPIRKSVLSNNCAWTHIQGYSDVLWSTVQSRLDKLIETPISRSCFSIAFFWRTIAVSSDEDWENYTIRNR
jgi:hypothetical protein